MGKEESGKPAKRRGAGSASSSPSLLDRCIGICSTKIGIATAVVIALAAAAVGVYMAASASSMQEAKQAVFDEVFAEALSKNPPPLSAVAPRAFQHIERAQWESGDDPKAAEVFLQRIIRDKKPVLIRGSPVSRWRAMDWDLFAARRNGMAMNTTRFSETPVFLVPKRDVSRQPNVLGTDMEFVNIKADEFMSSVFDQDTYLFWAERATTVREYVTGATPSASTAAGAGAGGRSRVKEEWDILRVADREDPDEVAKEDWPSMATLMHPGATLQTFSEHHHAFVAQIFGRSRYIFFPPTVEMHPYPYVHPCSRQSQIHLETGLPENVTSRIKKSFPDVAALSASTNAFEVVIQPGDLLYIPPYWYQRLESLTMSVSISVMTPSHITEVFQRAFSSYLPLGEFDDKGTMYRRAAAKLYLALLVNNVDVLKGTSLEDFAIKLYQSRFAYLFPKEELFSAANNYKCPSTNDDVLVALLKKHLNSFRFAAMEVSGHINDLDAEAAIKVEFLRDMAEKVVQWAVGSDEWEVPRFILACLQ